MNYAVFGQPAPGKAWVLIGYAFLFRELGNLDEKYHDWFTVERESGRIVDSKNDVRPVSATVYYLREALKVMLRQ